jgi:hypothetical protein
MGGIIMTVREKSSAKVIINLLAILGILLFFVPTLYGISLTFNGNDILFLRVVSAEGNMPSGNMILENKPVLMNDLEGRLKGLAKESTVLLITYSPSMVNINDIKGKASSAGIKRIIAVEENNFGVTEQSMRTAISGKSAQVEGRLNELIAQYEETQKKQAEILAELKAQIEKIGRFGEATVEETATILNMPIPLGDRFRKAIEMPASKEQKLVINGGFEDAMKGWDVGHSLDLSKMNWDCQIVYDEDKESNVVQFERIGSDASGSSIGVSQDVFIDLSQYNDVKLKLDVCPMYQSLSGGGYVGGEYPVMVQIAFIDEQNNPYVWTYGFIYDGETEYKNVTKIDQFKWFTYESPNLKEILPDSADEKRLSDMQKWGQPFFEYKPPVKPKYITRVLVFGSGWDFKSRADNIEFILTPK